MNAVLLDDHPLIATLQLAKLNLDSAAREYQAAVNDLCAVLSRPSVSPEAALPAAGRVPFKLIEEA